MKITPTAYELVETKTFSDVACGRVVPFSIPTRVNIALPKNTAYHPKTFYASGDSLVEAGIQHGDLLICQTNFSIYDIRNKVCVLCFHGEYLAKIVVPNSDGTLTLKSANPYYIDRTVDADSIEIVGVVKSIQRKL